MHARAKWQRLRDSVRTDGVKEITSLADGVNTGYGPIRYALGSSVEPRLLVPCAPDTRLGELSAQNLRVMLSSLQLEGESHLYIDIICLSVRLEPVFAELADEICRRVAAGEPPARAVSGGINDFRDLLKEQVESSVRTEEIIGVLGELFFLHHVCGIDPAGVDTWTGPHDDRHDFRRDVHGFEIKTSSRADATKVSVHGIEQLSTLMAGSLTLIHVRIERAAGGDLTVGRLVDRLAGLGVDVKVIAKGLTKLGCHDPQAPEWNRLAFNLVGLEGYDVVPGFPRIIGTSFTEGSIPWGISNVCYDIHLNQAGQWKLDDAQLDLAVRRLIS